MVKKDKNIEIEKQTKTESNTFTKEQLVNSVKYKRYTDLINSFMKDDERITLIELDKRIENFLRKEIK